MVKSKPELKIEDKPNQLYEEKVDKGLSRKPVLEKKVDKTIDQVNIPEPTDEYRQKIEEICPHYYILQERYAEYRNVIDEETGKTLPLRIDRQHELSGFEATIAQADPSKDIDVFPTRLVKVFVFNEQYTKDPFLIVDKRVTGIDAQGRSTNISSVRTGYYKYPTQFEQTPSGEWRPVNNQFKKIYDIPFEKETVLKFANVGNPYIKKYVVWHPDGVRRGHFTLEDFINLSDQEQITLIEQGKR